MVWGLAVALQVMPRHPAELVDGCRGTRLQGAGNRRLLGTVRPPKGPLHSGIDPNGHITLRDGLGPTEDAQQGIEHLLDGAMADRLLGDGDLLAQGGKETVPP